MRNNKWYILHLFILLLCSLVLVPGNTAVADTGTGEVENLPVQSDQVLPDGEYVIAVTADTHYYLDIRGSGVASDHNVVQLIGPVVANKVPDDDIWMIEYDNNDQYYTIKQKGSNMCLNVPNASKEQGVNLEVLTCADKPEQKWAITMNADSSYRLTNKDSGFCMDNPEGTIIVEKQIAQYAPNDTIAQKWTFFEREKPVVNNCVVSDVTSAGYTVTCDVSDNVGVVKTRFPTWPEDGSSEHNYLEIPWPERTPTAEGKASYQVNVNGKNGLTYTTHIYAHDAVDNEGIAGVSVYVPKSDSGERLELKGSLDGVELESLVKDGVTYATADIYLNDASKPNFQDQTEFNQTIPAETRYRIVVKPAAGFAFAEGKTGEFTGTITTDQIITVRPEIVTVLPASITLNPSGTASVESGKTLQLTATVLPENAADKTVEWDSSDPTVATVDENGLITGVAEGTATITVTSNAKQDVMARIQVTVTAPAHHGMNFWRFDIAGQPLPRTGFSAVRPQALPEMPLDLNYQPLRWTLEIPSLSVAADLVKVPNVDGEYPIDWLGDKVGLLEGFAMPGEGYTVLTGHNHLNTTEAGPFALLSSLEEGDRIFVWDANDGIKMFVVYANEKVSETDYDAVESIAAEYEDSLTMVTCEDERIEGGYANRRIVAARPY